MQGFGQRPGDAALGHVDADLEHDLLELLAVLGPVDDLGPGADQLDVVLGQDAVLVQGHRGVEPGLAAERRQQGVGFFPFDDLGDDFPGDRLDIGAVGRVRIGHDGRRVRVDQDDLVTFLAERLAGLGAGIVELAGLADDDRAGADEENLAQVGAFGHRGNDTNGRPGNEPRKATRAKDGVEGRSRICGETAVGPTVRAAVGNPGSQPIKRRSLATAQGDILAFVEVAEKRTGRAGCAIRAGDAAGGRIPD